MNFKSSCVSIKSPRGEENIIRILSKTFFNRRPLPSALTSLSCLFHWKSHSFIWEHRSWAETQVFREQHCSEYRNTRGILEYRIHKYTKYTRIQNTWIHKVYLNTEYINTRSILEYRIHEYTKAINPTFKPIVV